MAQIRCEILAHTIKLIADSRHPCPSGLLPQSQGSPEGVPQRRFDRERDRGFESPFLQQLVGLSWMLLHKRVPIPASRRWVPRYETFPLHQCPLPEFSKER
jgi:hypothetical protein